MSNQDRPADQPEAPRRPATAAQAAGAAGRAEFAEEAEHAEFAEVAEVAQYAEFAEHAAHADAGVSAEEDQQLAEELRKHGHLPHVGQVDALWRHEMAHLVDQAANRFQAAQQVGRARIHHQDRPEPRWPVTAAVAVALTLQLTLPRGVSLRPSYLLPGLEIALLIGLSIANPVRIEKRSRPIRYASVALIVLITAANAVSAGLLVKGIVTNTQAASNALTLLGTGASIWLTNVIAFGLWYWEFDRGGPVQRLEGTRPLPDLMFPQMTAPELAPDGWGPRFVDYLYLSFTNATAFSPTDVMPLARWAKMTMLVQSAVSLVMGALVIARAVNILK